MTPVATHGTRQYMCTIVEIEPAWGILWERQLASHCCSRCSGSVQEAAGAWQLQRSIGGRSSRLTIFY